MVDPTRPNLRPMRHFGSETAPAYLTSGPIKTPLARGLNGGPDKDRTCDLCAISEAK